MNHQCPRCHNPVDLDITKAKARNHRTRRGGPWCDGGGEPIENLIKIND